MDNERLLNSPLAKKIYDAVKNLPIIDYHNHLCINDIAEDKGFDSITKVWISSDPYKHRAMRILGISERLITGDGTDAEKFSAWYSCLPRLIGNALYDWSIMEFSSLLDIELEPFDKSAEEVWQAANERLTKLSPRKLLSKFNIEYCAPCQALCDDISLYGEFKEYAPSLRGDDLLLPTSELILRLEALTGGKVNCLKEYIEAIEKRLGDFVAAGCRYTDHALDDGFRYTADDGRNDARFRQLISGAGLNEADRLSLTSYILTALASLYSKQSLTMQLHIGAKRDTSTNMRKAFGAAGGYAGIGGCVSVGDLCLFLDSVDRASGLPKTLLFTLNPADNAVMATLSGSYKKDGVQAQVSQGPAWWWCDHYQGICDMLDSFSAYSVLSTFIGMTTDSRSLFSLSRHDYFRRIVARWLADRAQDGILPSNEALLTDTAKRICYYNARETVR